MNLAIISGFKCCPVYKESMYLLVVESKDWLVVSIVWWKNRFGATKCVSLGFK